MREQKDVVIPEGTEKIGRRWFQGCGVESVTIPASVKKVGDDAFLNCRSLKRVIFASEGQLEKICAGSF